MATAPAPTATEPLRVMEGFLSPEKCRKLIDTYDSKCKPSTVVSAKGDVQDEARTSWTFYMPDEDPIVIEMRGRVAAAAGVPADHIEGLQFLRYQKGQQYKFHYDYFDAIRHNQRVHTFLVYLNDLDMADGGSTIFKRLNMKVYPKEGRAVWFRNMTEDGRLNTDSLHAGEPIATDKTKYAVNIWVRQKKVATLTEAATPTPSPVVLSMGSDVMDNTKPMYTHEGTSWLWTVLATLLVLLVLGGFLWLFRDSKHLAPVWRWLQAAARDVRSTTSGRRS